MNVVEIVEDYLKKNGFDGLYNDGNCACEIGELAPCDNMDSNCEPGYKIPYPGPEECGLDGGCNFHMSRNKPKPPANNRN